MTTSIVDLHEYEAAEIGLSADHALALRACRVVDVAPGWSAGTYRLKAGPIIGALDLGAGLLLRVSPKLEIRRVVFLLCHAAGLATWDDRLIELDDDAPIDIALAEAFALAAERALRQGPRSGYYTVEEDLPEVRGRLDANRQRLRYGLPLPVSVTYDEYGIDVPENQLILGAALQLQRMSNVPGHLRRRLRRIASSLDGARAARRDEARIPVHFDRLNERYRPAIALSRAALEGVSFDVGPGRRAVTGFTVDMNKLFEKFLEVALGNALSTRHSGQLSVQRSDHLDVGRRARIIPDLTWMQNGAPSVVIDAKYKDPADGKADDDDLYQVVAYCVALGIDRAFLVHATMAASGTLAIRSSSIEVVMAGLDLAAPLPSLRGQIAHLADAIAVRPLGVDV